MDYDKLRTPCYILKVQELKNNIQCFHAVLKEYFDERYVIGYSFKTNALPYLLKIVREQGGYAEVVSDTEYSLAMKTGFKPEQIIYNGPIKTKASFIYAVKNHSIVNIDSKQEIQWIRELSEVVKEIRVGIRVNFDLEQVLPGHTVTGEAGGRFGFCDDNDELKNCISQLKKMNTVTIDGLHMHVSNKTKNKEVYRQLIKRACQIIDKEHLDVSYIDIGGGFFGGGDEGEAYRQYVKTIYDELCMAGKQNLRLIVEPGASVVATAVDYLVSVKDVKETTRNRFVVTDGSRLHIDPFFTKKKYNYKLYTMSQDKQEKQILCGYTCMEQDRFMELTNANILQLDDSICFQVVGSYTMCFNSMFIRYLPRVYAVDGEEYFEVRHEWDVGEYMQKNEIGE